jgi:hypothetical protein
MSFHLSGKILEQMFLEQCKKPPLLVGALTRSGGNSRSPMVFD